MFFAPAIMLFLPAPMWDTSNPIGAPVSPYLFCAPVAVGDTSSPDRCTIFSLLVLRSCGHGGHKQSRSVHHFLPTCFALLPHGGHKQPERCTIFSLLVLRSCGMGDTRDTGATPLTISLSESIHSDGNFERHPFTENLKPNKQVLGKKEKAYCLKYAFRPLCIKN